MIGSVSLSTGIKHGRFLLIFNSSTALAKKFLKIFAIFLSSDMFPSSIMVMASSALTLSVKAGLTVFQNNLLSVIEDGFDLWKYDNLVLRKS